MLPTSLNWRQKFGFESLEMLARRKGTFDICRFPVLFKIPAWQGLYARALISLEHDPIRFFISVLDSTTSREAYCITPIDCLNEHKYLVRVTPRTYFSVRTSHYVPGTVRILHTNNKYRYGMYLAPSSLCWLTEFFRIPSKRRVFRFRNHLILIGQRTTRLLFRPSNTSQKL